MVAVAHVMTILALALGSPHGRPASTGVSLKLPADSAVTTTGVVWKDGTAWFAVAVNGVLRIYRWRNERWVLDGSVNLPAGLPGLVPPGGSLGFTSITGSVAPDFTSHAYGADTLWFALVARLRGRWRVVPFDDQFGRRHPYTFASGAKHHLIQGIFDACGCAGGPTTFQSYRFAQGVFVPTRPLGRAAPCSAKALGTAAHWPQIPDDPLLRDVARPFRLGRFACADGWALATDGHKLGIYEQNGLRWLQRYEPAGGRWLRVGVGSPRLVGTAIEFAPPRSVLSRLGRRIGVHLPPQRPETVANQPPAPLTKWQRAPITSTFRPGDTYVQTGLFDRRPKVLTVMITSYAGTKVAGTRVTRFRWRNGGWVRLPARR